MNARRIAYELLGLVREVSEFDRVHELEVSDDFDWSPLPPEDQHHHDLSHRAGQLVDALARTLEAEGWAPDGVENSAPRAIGRWTERARPRVIRSFVEWWPQPWFVGGYLEPLRHRPLVARVPAPVVLYLLRELPDGEDALEREKHGVGNGMGWHYHYLDRRRRRSDVILSWDTRWDDPDPHALRPLFVESHAEGKAEFHARPDRWQDPRRQAIHELCSLDLGRPMSQFRPASNDADSVWPRFMRMTPAPLPPPLAAPKHPAKPRRR